MTDSDGTASATGSTATVEAAAERIASLLSDDGDSAGGETQEGKPSTAADEEEVSEETETEEAEESDESEETEEQGEQPELHVVKIGDEELSVTLDEALKGYQRTQDYTRKTMALAEERKSLDAEKQSTAQEREQYAQALERMATFFASAEDDTEELAALRNTDPAEYAARVAEKQQRATYQQGIKAEQTRVAEQAKREAAGKFAEQVKAEEAKLLKAIPDWSDEAKRKAGQAEVIEYALSLGLEPAEVAEIYDHRLVLALRDAAKWRALQARTPQVQARVDAVKTAKPGSASQRSPVTELTRAKQRLAKTGSVHDAAAALLLKLG